MWIGSSKELHGHVCILLHLSQFCMWRQTRYQPYGPWPHVAESLWHKKKPPMRMKKMMTVFVANCVCTVYVIHLNVALHPCGSRQKLPQGLVQHEFLVLPRLIHTLGGTLARRASFWTRAPPVTF